MPCKNYHRWRVGGRRHQGVGRGGEEEEEEEEKEGEEENEE